MLILDLDDTIFETKSIPAKTFEPALVIIKDYYLQKENINLKQLIEDLWINPIDVVFEKYQTPQSIQNAFFKKLQTLEYNLDIKTFEDYHLLKNLGRKKVLVTTGYQKLQWAKINGLGIETDFEKIYIDDPLDSNRKYKLGIFREVQELYKIPANDFWVIGDNPDNELAAGKKLGMKTIQRLKKGKEKSSEADFAIKSFDELLEILI